jgi:hypothetical protein
MVFLFWNKEPKLHCQEKDKVQPCYHGTQGNHLGRGKENYLIDSSYRVREDLVDLEVLSSPNLRKTSP